MNDTCKRLCWTALISAETDRLAPGLDHYWIMHTLNSPALRGAMRRQMFVEWLHLYVTRVN